LKAIKHIFSFLLWSFVTLYVALIILSHIPAVQEEIGRQTASLLGEELNTKVSVGDVNLGFLNKVVIDDVCIYDQHEQEMLKIGRLATRVDLLPLLSGKISVSSIQLFSAKAQLSRKDSLSALNCQFLIDAFASEDTTSHTPLDLRVNSVIIRRSSVSYDQLDAPSSETLNPHHLAVDEISAYLILKTLTDDSLDVNIKRLSFKEKSGLDVNKISMKIAAGKSNAQLSNFIVQLPHSTFTIEEGQATYDAERFRETLDYEISGIQSTVCPRDFACFYKPLRNFNEEINLNTSIKGTGTMLRVPVIAIDTPNHSLVFNGDVWAENIHQKHPHWRGRVSGLSISENLLHKLQHHIEGIPAFVSNLEQVVIAGRVEGKENGDIDIHGTLDSGAGHMKANFLMMGNPKHPYSATVEATGLDLHKILGDADLGRTSAHLQLNGNKGYANIKGTVSKFEYKSYAYQNIAVDGRIIAADLLKGMNQQIEAIGHLTINDPHLLTNIEGSLQKHGKKMDVRIKGELDDFSPKALHLSDNWGDAVFSASFLSDCSATNLNDIEGTVSLTDFLMQDSLYRYAIDKIELQSGYQEGVHFLKINGDMGHAELMGQFDWDTLPQSFINFVGSRLPTLPGLPATKKEVNNDFTIQVNLNNTDWMQRLLNVPFLIYQPLTITANIQDASHEVNIDAKLPSFTYNGEPYHDAHIHIDTPKDTIICNASVTKSMGDDSNMSMRLQANAYDNQLFTNFLWDNHEENDYDKFYGELNTLTQLYTDDKNNPEAYLHVDPSHIIVHGARWDMMPCNVFYSDNNLTIEQFSVKHKAQHLTINGVASKLPTDTLSIDLKDVDVEYVLDLVNFHAVKFEGLATGNAYVIQPFDSLTAKADLIVKDFRFEDGRMGTLNAHAQWNQETKQIDIHALADDGLDAHTKIDGYVSPVREDILLDIQAAGTYIDFTKTYTSSFLDNLTGHAYGSVQLVGPLGEMDLLGKLVIDGSALVKPLGTTYTLHKDTLYLVEDDIQIRNAEIKDKYQNSAFISGGIHHENLSNLTFDLDVETHKLLAYDFPDYGNEVFCGHILAGGKVDLHGRPGEIVINCDVTPQSSSVFYYNASSTDAVSTQDFIKWSEKTTDTLKIAATLPQPEEEDIPSDLYLNFLINTTNDANLRLLMDERTNDYISLYGSGVIRAAYHNKGAFTMYGTYRVNRGTYGLTIQNIIKKNFQFNDGGTIVFGGNPMNATLNLQAVHTVNGVSLSDLNIGNSFSSNTIRVNCLMNILGQAGAPRVEFDLDMPNVNSEEKQMIRSIITSEQEMNQQVVYLLGIGRFYTQGINNADQNADQQYGQTQLAMQSFLSGTLSSQINEVISGVIKNDNWNFGANISTGNEGWHNAEYEGMVSGRLFNNRLLINGQFGYRDNARQATPSFIGDFDIRYLLQPNGNLALKVYNQTNDRYFTKSSLNTQGIGIIIKRDFDNLGELFKRKK